MRSINFNASNLSGEKTLVQARESLSHLQVNRGKTPQQLINGESSAKQAQMSTSSTFNEKEQREKIQNQRVAQGVQTAGNGSKIEDETEAFSDENSNNIDNQGCNFANLPKNNDEENQEVVQSKKPNFSVVCMLPTKHGKHLNVLLAPHKDKAAQLLDQTSLTRILQLQKQNQSIKNNQGKLNIKKIGLCGIPSIWISKAELIRESHFIKEQLEEHERLERMLQILQIHKKYEIEKYFGGGGVLKRGTRQLNGINLNMQAMSEYVLFSTDNIIARGKGATTNEKINSIVNYENSSQLTPIDAQKNGAIQSGQGQVGSSFPIMKSTNDGGDQLYYKILQAEAKLVRMVLDAHGFQHTESNDWNVLWTCTATQQKSHMYENLHENQKVNHFVNSNELTRKDRFCFNIGKMEQKFGREHYDFTPQTFILPEEFQEFYKMFNQQAKTQEKNLWIIKPQQSSQGKGIYIVDDISEVPLNEQLVVSKYIENPLLINGLKFDLRLYVLVTDFDPLKIYIYNEGLVRFASEPYNINTVKSNVFAHLTNYSINKKNEFFIQNKTLNERDFGNKWSLSALQTHLLKLGIDMSQVWERIYDSIIKSLISVEGPVNNAMKRIQNVNNQSNRSNCFDLFGFDIILDQDLKPWILEVNLSPSLAFDSPLDFHIKSNLLVDVFNLVGIKKHQRRRDFIGKQIKVKAAQGAQSQNVGQVGSELNKRYQSAMNGGKPKQSDNQLLNKTETNSQALENCGPKNQYEGINIAYVERLSKINAKHRELLRDHLDEFNRNKKLNFTRVYPAPGAHIYDQFFESPRPLNKLLYKYLYQQSDLQEIINLINKQCNQQKQANQDYLQGEIEPQILSNQEKKLNEPLLRQSSDSVPPFINSKESPMGNNRSTSMSQMKIAESPLVKTQKLNENYSNTFSLKKTLDRQLNATNTINVPQFDLSEPQTKDNPRFLRNNNLGTNENIKSQNETLKKQNTTIENINPLPQQQEEKIVITGDDILIEYVRRIMKIMRNQQATQLPQPLIKKLELFLTHKVWFSTKRNPKEDQSLALYDRIESRIREMVDRKKRMHMKKQIKNQIDSEQLEKSFMDMELQKDDIIKDFPSHDLEQMLIQSNQNNQIEVVGQLLYTTPNQIGNTNMSYVSGILTKLEKESQRMLHNGSTGPLILKMKSSDGQNLNDLEKYEQPFATPKERSNRDSQDFLVRLKTSVDKNKQGNKIQNFEKFHSSFSKHKQHSFSKMISNAAGNLQNSNMQSKQNLLILSTNTADARSSKKSSRLEKEYLQMKQLKESQKLILPQIINQNSQDFTKLSLQLSDYAKSGQASQDSSGMHSNIGQSYLKQKSGKDKNVFSKFRNQSLNNQNHNLHNDLLLGSQMQKQNKYRDMKQ